MSKYKPKDWVMLTKNRRLGGNRRHFGTVLPKNKIVMLTYQRNNGMWHFWFPGMLRNLKGSVLNEKDFIKVTDIAKELYV